MSLNVQRSEWAELNSWLWQWENYYFLSFPPLADEAENDSRSLGGLAHRSPGGHFHMDESLCVLMFSAVKGTSSYILWKDFEGSSGKAETEVWTLFVWSGFVQEKLRAEACFQVANI